MLTGRKKNKNKLQDKKYLEFLETQRKLKEEYTAYLEILRKPRFTSPHDVTSRDGFMDVGFILINLLKTSRFGAKTKYKINRTFKSMLTYSRGESLHFIVITDDSSLQLVGNFFAQFISRRVSEDVINKPGWRKRFIKGVPKIDFSFVRLEDIKNVNPQFVTILQMNTEAKDDETIDKYSSDLFYVGPIFHEAFKQLNKLLVIDVTDLEFFDNLSDLYKQFENFDEELIGVGVDASPHYRKFLENYLRDHPSSPLGLPGSSQGLNTGVVLYRLDNMRKNKLYQVRNPKFK